MYVAKRAANWPENAPYGSHALHLHYMELVDIWNEYARMNRTDTMLPCRMIQVNNGNEVFSIVKVKSGSEHPESLTSHSVTQFELMFKLSHGIVKRDVTFIQLCNIFPRSKVDTFLRVLDTQRCELLATHNEWETARPSLNSVFTESAKLFDRFKNAHEAIAEARTALFKKEDIA